MHLAKITPENVDGACALRVLPAQEKFVAPVVKSLAEAYAHGDRAWPRLIMDGDRVGFLMLGIDPKGEIAVLWERGDGSPETFYLKLGFATTGE